MGNTTHHVSEQDLINTSVEESVHQALSICGSSLIANVEQEEWFLEQMFWVLNDWSVID